MRFFDINMKARRRNNQIKMLKKEDIWLEVVEASKKEVEEVIWS